jgi:hypothetical protein
MSRSPARSGVVLFSVLVIIAILILVGYQFFNLMNAEFAATIASNKVLQSRHLAESGVNYTSFVLTHPETAGLSADGVSPLVYPPAAYDNSQLFHMRPVAGGDTGTRGYFSVVSLRDATDPLAPSQGFRFGVEDENGKINLNTLVLRDQGNQAKNILSRLPNMNEDLADAILKWIKPSDGSDSLTYSSLGYTPKNGALESLEELLFVRGMTPRLLLGNDRSRNGRIEPDEDDSGGVIDPGLARYVTLYSRELDIDSTGLPRTFLNDKTDGALQTLQSKLAELLPQETVDFIMLCRIQGGMPTSGRSQASSGGGGMRIQLGGQNNQGSPPKEGITVTPDGKFTIDYSKAKPAQDGTIATIFDLIDHEVVITLQERGQGGGGRGGGGQGGGGRGGQARTQTIRIRSPLRKADKSTLRTVLPVLFDKFTTRDPQNARYGSLEMAARVNINSAPQEVIKAFPNITDADLQKIMTYRPTPETDPSLAPVYNSLTWLVTEADMEIASLRDYEQYFTARSQVFRFQVVGYFETNGPTTRLEAVVDVNGGRPRLLYWRDITSLGRGFDFSQYQPTLP